MKAIRSLTILTLVLILCTTLMPVASAHRVYVQEQINEVQIRAWYGGGTPMADADVEIFFIKDGAEKLYLENKTDEDGMFNFTPKLGVSQYRVVVSATGHSAEKIIDMAGGVQEEAELPLSMRILAGFGYLAGLAGLGMILSARKLKKEQENN